MRTIHRHRHARSAARRPGCIGSSISLSPRALEPCTAMRGTTTAHSIGPPVPRGQKLGMGPIVPLVHAKFRKHSAGQIPFTSSTTNNGALFPFEQLSGQTWMTREASQRSAPTWNPAIGAGPDLRALAAITPTDVMIVGIHEWPAGWFADPLTVEGRAALYSFGFMLRRTAAVRLDISGRRATDRSSDDY